MRNLTSRGSRLAIGLISGTSMDGVDAALVRISGPPEKLRVRLIAFTSLAYPEWVRKRLLEIAGQYSTSAGEISQVNFLLGHLFGEAARRVMKKGGVEPKRVSVIGSHGQTIYHQGRTAAIRGKREFAMPNTLQIAEPCVIAEITRLPVVADFRTADVAAGGQGAPLVPMVDYLLLRDNREGRVALNIGGIANVTVIPARAKPNQVFGFDTGPGNMVMDTLVRRFTEDREAFDVGGRAAKLGQVIEPLLKEALTFPFFARRPPKSAGREEFGGAFVQRYFLSRRRPRFEDLLRTANELTARTISDALSRFVFPRVKVHRLIVSGGGAHNRLLMTKIADLLPKITVERSDRYGLPVDAKEAIAFAVLADRTLHNLPGNLPAVTGARRAVRLGKLTSP
jgi:anhydro-N-acetylmuramic acid kinase